MVKDFKVDDRVIAQKAPGGSWHEAVIRLLVKDGNILVRFDDGFTCSVAPNEIRPKASDDHNI